ncbi:MAG: DNA polymerase IV [Anaerorhabdus sp.]
MAKIIVHVDLNSFFAAVEVIKNPNLKGKPIAVSGYTRRSVISTASYEARKFGVNSAMSTQLAQRLCPELIIVQGNYSVYKEYSKKFIEIISRYSSLIEVASIDECYADITETMQKYKRPLDCLVNIQNTVFNELGLDCSIGVGPNKFLAKMASDMKKPKGITVLRIQEIQKKLWPLPIESMRGVGKQTAPLLHDINIHTIKDLAVLTDTDCLLPIFGKNSDLMIDRANGIDNRGIELERELKSMSQSTTLLTDLTDYEEIKQTIYELLESLSFRLQRYDKVGNHLSLTIKYFDFTIRNCSKKLSFYSSQSDELFPYVLELLDENITDKPIRLLGVSVGSLKEEKDIFIQQRLFDI